MSTYNIRCTLGSVRDRKYVYSFALEVPGQINTTEVQKRTSRSLSSHFLESMSKTKEKTDTCIQSLNIFQGF